MKLKKMSNACYGVLLIGTLISCGKDYLEVEPKGTALEENYYSNEAEAYSALVAVYDVLAKESRGFENMVTFMNAGSDDHFAGGGNSTDGAGIQSFSNYSIDPSTIPASYWNDYYQGIFRANVLLEKLPGIPMDDAKKNRFAAEAKTLRSYYYFQLLRMFKNIPLITSSIPTSEIYNIVQADPNDVYAQIEQDLLDSKDNLPNTITTDEELGRLTKGAAQAILGKIYLYDGKNALAAAELAEVNGTPGGTSMYGYSLVPDFSDLWNFSNIFNSESILEVSHTNQSNSGWGNWGAGDDEGNTINIMVGPRSYVRLDESQAPDYTSGWSFNVITPSLYNVLQNDPRLDATVANLGALRQAGIIDYLNGYQDTGYYLKKFMPHTEDITTGGGNIELNYKQHVYIIRLADTYLMEAEALGASGARAQALLDAVRARVGLAPVPVSMDAIMKERRLELAGEGHRWFDLVRWGNAASVLSSRGFTAGKNEILPIPLRELENTQIIQNPLY